MSASNDFQDQQEVRNLHRQAIDARTEGRYADQEDMLKKAVEFVGQLEELPLRVKERYWLADAQRMQGKHKDAITNYEWLIGLTTNPVSPKLGDKSSLYYLAAAFIYFVECGRHLPEHFLPEQAIEVLQRKIDEGLAWLKQVEKSNWAAGLYLQWGLLLRDQGKWEEAHKKLQDALDFARECTDAPGYTLATYQLELADLLCNTGFSAGAIHLAEEALAAVDSDTNERQRAYKTIVYARLEKEDMAAVHSPTLKDQPFDTTLKSTGTLDNQVLRQLQLVKEQLGQVTTVLHQLTSSHQQSTAPTIQFGESTNEQVEQPKISENELIKDFIRVTYEQARDYSKLLQEQSTMQVSLNSTVANQIISMAEQLKRLLADQPHLPAEQALHQNALSADSPTEKSDDAALCTEHIVCLVALPSDEKLPSGEKDDNFHKVLLPALREVLELDPYYWQVVCEDEKFFESIEQLNMLAWLKHAQAYIADITSGNFKVMIELGAMLYARKPEQPLLVLKRDDSDSTHDFTGILGKIIGMHMHYPLTSTSEKYDIERTADELRKQFLKHEGMIKLNDKKKAHYLSPLFMTKVCGLNDENAEKLSNEFTTMQEAVVKSEEDTFRRRAEAHGFPSVFVDGVREMIITCLKRQGAI